MARAADLSPLGLAARQYACRGWWVFPCEPREKRPLGRLAPRGLLDATLDLTAVARWWAEAPEANVAIACGPSGLVVLDLDGEAGEENYGRLLSTHGAPGSSTAPDGATARTPGGGWHVFLRAPYGLHVGSSTGRLGPGLDVRASGGYVVGAPSIHPAGGAYTWRDPVTPGGLPELSPAWAALLAAPERPAAAPAPLTLRPHGASAYGAAAARSELEKVLRASEGERNARLNEAAFALGCLVAGGELAAEPTRAALRFAGERVGLGPREVERTVASGFETGLGQPRAAPERGAAA